MANEVCRTSDEQLMLIKPHFRRDQLSEAISSSARIEFVIFEASRLQCENIQERIFPIQLSSSFNTSRQALFYFFLGSQNSIPGSRTF
jgi:hypothetical protein